MLMVSDVRTPFAITLLGKTCCPARANDRQKTTVEPRSVTGTRVQRCLSFQDFHLTHGVITAVSRLLHLPGKN